MKQPWCRQCAKPIDDDDEEAEKLYNKPDGREVWVCSRACLKEYNDE